MSTHAQAQKDDAEVTYVLSTNRDLVFEQLVKQHKTDFKVRWTTREMQESVSSDISEDTVRSVLNSLAQLGLLKHKRKSRYWYLEPEWF